MPLLPTGHLFSDVRFSRAWFLNYGKIVLGSAISATGYVFFLIPYKIVPGGVFGLSIIIHHLTSLPTGILALILNIPLLIWGIKELGPRFGVKTLLGLVLTSVFTDVFTLVFPKVAFLWDGGISPAAEPMLACVFGGVLTGLGGGLVFRAKATSGGTDIVAQVVNKRLGTPVGQVLMVSNAVVILAGVVLLQELSLALYGVVAIFVSGRVIDSVLTGSEYYKTLLIISDKHEMIRERILQVLGRGGTYLSGQGLFTEVPKKVILSAVSRRELPAIEEYIRKLDPEAFIIVLDSREIIGKGFKGHDDSQTAN